MASLQGKTGHGEVVRLGLSPRPSNVPGQDATEYDLTVQQGADGAVWARVFSTAGYFTKQDEVWAIARLFILAPQLAATTVPLNLFGAQGERQAYGVTSVDWLQAVMVGNQKQERVAVTLHVQEADDPALFRRVFLRTSAAQAQVFGQQLEQEIIAACPRWAMENKVMLRHGNPG